MVLDGMRTYIDAMRSDISTELSKPSVLDISMVPLEQQQGSSEARQDQFSSQKFSNEAQCNNDSLTDMTS